MKKFCYLISIAGHALLLLIIVNTRFWVTIRPEPPRVIAVRIQEPPPPPAAEGVPAWARLAAGAMSSRTGSAGAVSAAGSAGGAKPAPASQRYALSFPATNDFSLSHPGHGTFRLAPVGRSPEPWATPLGPEPGPATRRLRYGANAYRPVAAPGGDGEVFLLPFAISEKAVADWTEAVLARIERNWTIPASGRLAFSGRVQITLTVERQGSERSLVIDDANVPAPLTQAALHAVQASLPLPPLPENVAAGSLAFTFVFAYNG